MEERKGGRPRHIRVKLRDVLVGAEHSKYYRTFTSKGILIPPGERERTQLGQECRHELAIPSKEASILLDRGVIEKIGVETPETEQSEESGEESPTE